MAKLFEWNGFNSIQATEFNNWIEKQPAAFNKQIDYHLIDGQKFGFHIHQPAKGAFHAYLDGDLLLTRQKGQPNLRTRISPMWGGGTQRWRYLQLKQKYRFEMDFMLPKRNDNYTGVHWANIFEIWGPFDGHDSGRNPAFEVMIRGKSQKFEFRQRGDSKKDHDRDYEFGRTNHIPFSHGKHKLVVETTLDYEWAGEGETKVWFDGEKVMDLKAINTYNSDPFGDGKPIGGLINFPELYTPDSSVENEPLQMDVSRMLVTDGEPEPEPKPVPGITKLDVTAKLDLVTFKHTPKQIIFKDQ